MSNFAGALVEAKSYFIGVELFDGYIGHDVTQDGNDVVLQFSDVTRGVLLGVRFPGPVLPREGLAYRGVLLRNARDWILDLRIVLGEELATGVLFKAEPVARSGWTEFFVAPERWEGASGRTIGDWARP